MYLKKDRVFIVMINPIYEYIQNTKSNNACLKLYTDQIS